MKYIMKYSFSLKLIILFITAIAFDFNSQAKSIQVEYKFKNIEKSFHGKIGIYAINTNNHQIISFRANERFPVQSTMKFMAVSALLKQSENNINLLQEKIIYSKNDLISWHPITGKYIDSGMTLEALAEAAITYSDNPAVNLIMKKFGGPKFTVDFAKSINNNTYNVTHYDGYLNSDPKKDQDTSTPKDMTISVEKLILGNVLAETQRKKLMTWMKNNTTGYKRMRAGVPIGWIVADKTGSGDYGIANDIGVLWAPICKPIVLSIYTIRNTINAKIREDVLALITNIIINEFSKNDPCFKI